MVICPCRNGSCCAIGSSLRCPRLELHQQPCKYHPVAKRLAIFVIGLMAQCHPSRSCAYGLRTSAPRRQKVADLVGITAENDTAWNFYLGCPRVFGRESGRTAGATVKPVGPSPRYKRSKKTKLPPPAKAVRSSVLNRVTHHPVPMPGALTASRVGWS